MFVPKCDFVQPQTQGFRLFSSSFFFLVSILILLKKYEAFTHKKEKFFNDPKIQKKNQFAASW